MSTSHRAHAQRATRQRRAVGLVAAAGATVLVTACGSSSSGGGTTSGSADSGNNSSSGPSIAFPSDSFTGKVASVGQAGAKVTTAAGSTNVVFGTSTRFSQVSDSSLSAVKVGDCVSIGSKNSNGKTSAVTATTVTVTSTTACAGPSRSTIGGGHFSGGGAPGGSAPGGSAPGGGTAQPFTSGEGGPPNSASGGSGSTGGPTPPIGFGTMGTVSSISGRSIVIKSVGSGQTTVTTTNATTYRTRKDAAASDVKTGLCLSGFGQKPGTDIDALTVTISTPTNGKCTAVTDGGPSFAGGPGGQGGPGVQGGPGGTSTPGIPTGGSNG